MALSASSVAGAMRSSAASLVGLLFNVICICPDEFPGEWGTRRAPGPFDIHGPVFAAGRDPFYGTGYLRQRRPRPLACDRSDPGCSGSHL